MIGALLILVVIVLSGLIAYVGDQIGMKVGKKRISIFGLRPKYTSIIITVLTGILIAGLTLTILFATNNGVRQAVFNIQKTVAELQTTRSKLDNTTNSLQDTRSELSSAQNELAEKEIELQKRNALLDQRDEEITERNLELNNLQRQLEQMEQQREELAAENNSLEEQRDRLQAKLDDLQVELQTARDSIDVLEVEQQQLETQIEDLRVRANLMINSLYDAAYKYYSQDLVYYKGEIVYIDVIEKETTQVETTNNINEFIKNANQEVLKREVRVDERGTAILLQSGDVYSLASRIISSDAEKFIISMVSTANVSTNMYVPVSFQMSPDFIVYQKGEMITEQVIDAGQPLAEVEDALFDILTTIKVESIKKGIITNEQGTVGAMDFIRGYEVLNKLESYQGEVQVTVRAVEDIWVEDGWNGKFSDKINFDIEPVDGNNDE
ncbi:MAG: DUF3084 domain-containing protein [Halanaerobiales bacterium]